jgi:hypothetical protein
MPVLCLSQAGQDVFARYVIGRKGTFLDLGSFRPTYHNNTRVLELEGWSGLSIDYQDFGEEFKQKRNTPFLHADVTTIDWNKTLQDYPFLNGTIDYISFDVDGATRTAFDLFPFDKIKFGCMTIEHDQYRVGTELRDYLRKKLTELGYVLLCADVVMPDSPYEKFGAFEDWWVNEEFFDAKFLDTIRCENIYGSEVIKKFGFSSKEIM